MSSHINLDFKYFVDALEIDGIQNFQQVLRH